MVQSPWGERRVVFMVPAKGKFGGPTESPTVVRRGDYYYLFIGPWGGYVGTAVFRSKNPYKWQPQDKVGHILSHAAEVIRDVDGQWYISHCGWNQGGLYLAKLHWNDDLDDADTSMPIPAKNLSAAENSNHLTAEEQAAGWTLLFDGVNTRGWLEVTGLPFPTTAWTVEDGCLKAIPNPQGVQDIRTVDSYHSFELQFEWKILKDGNSGVKYVVQHTDRWQRKGRNGYEARARGLEYQIVDNASGDAKDPTRITASLYSALAPKGAAPKPLGQFNQSRIVVREGHVEHWLNGVKVLECELSQSEVAKVLLEHERPAGHFVRESPICLQNHSTPGSCRTNHAFST